MFKLNITHKNTYSEMGQANPMKWRIMYKEEDGSLSSQSGLIICKDFFNDVVAWKQVGEAFNIYRFDNKIKFNDEGVYFLLSNIAKRAFNKNVKIMNERLEKDLGVSCKTFQQGTGEVVTLIPNEVWASTYLISVVSMLIRLCNYNILYTTWESFFDVNAPLNTIETAFTPGAKAFVLKHGFILPKALQGYWYFAPYGYNSKSKHDIQSNIVHNNGASNWAFAFNELGDTE